MVTQLRRGVPLRVGLVAATLILVGCGLLVSGVAVTSILRHVLVGRIDQTLLEASRGWAQAPRRQSPPPYESPDPGRPPSKFYVRGIGTDGTPFTAINDRNAEPALPPDNDVGPDPTTLPSVNGSDIEWRAVSVRGPHGLTTVAIDLSDVQHTVRSLVWLQVGIGVAVLVIVGIASFAVVARSLRPLAEVEQTAAAIAGGQLDRRIPQRDPRTEVGQLSLALNGMLTQIQEALASSESSAETGAQFRGTDAAVHHRRQPRTAHPADHHSRLRRVVPPGRRPRRVDAAVAHRERSQPDGPARGGPAVAGPAGRPAPARIPAGGPAGVGQRRGARRAGDGAEANGHHGGLRRPRHPRGAWRRGPDPPGAEQPAGQRPAAHPGQRRRHRPGRHRGPRRRASRWPTGGPA